MLAKSGGFRITDKQQTIVGQQGRQLVAGGTLRGVVKINQQVAAKNNVERLTGGWYLQRQQVAAIGLYLRAYCRAQRIALRTLAKVPVSKR